MKRHRSRRRIFVAGHCGMVGAALVRRLTGPTATAEGSVEIVTRTRAELDLSRQRDVEEFFGDEVIDEVYLAAAKVGGIAANDRDRADFAYQNLMIQGNVIHAAHSSRVEKLLFLGSSCVYPRGAGQPIREESLLSGPLEPTNEPYAIAKIAGLKLCESFQRQYGVDFRALMPSNLYGPGDNFHAEDSHVIPGMFNRFRDALATGAETVTIWGTGAPRREFLHVDDLADAAVHVQSVSLRQWQTVISPATQFVNVGTGVDCTILELAELIARTSGFRGRIVFDPSRPDGVPRKLLDCSRLDALGWRPRIGLSQGIKDAFRWFLENDGQRQT